MQPEPAWLHDDVEEASDASEEAPSVEAASPPPEPQEPETPEPEPALDEAPAVEGEQPAEEQPNWAEKYGSPEEVYKAYNDMRDLQNRTAVRNREVEARYAELERAMQQAIPIIQQWLEAQQQPQQLPQPTPQQSADIKALADQLGWDAPTIEAVRTIASTIADERVGGIRQELMTWQEQQQAQQLLAAQENAKQQEVRDAVAAVDGFFAAHPDITRGSDQDTQIHDIMVELDMAMQPELLEVAYEANNDPALLQVLRATPSYVETDEGMNLARQFANLVKAQQGSQPATAPAKRTPHVETGASGAPATTGQKPRQPLDPWEETLQQSRGELNALGLPKNA